MKKIAMFIGAAAFVAMSFSSCKKCTTCTYNFAGFPVSSGEYCAKKKDVEAFENSFKAGATFLGETATCTRK